MAERGGVGTRLYVAGGQEATRDFSKFGDDGKRAFDQIAAGARGVNPVLLGTSRAVDTVKRDVEGLATQAGAAGRYLGAFGAAGVAVAAGVAGAGIALQKTREALDFADELGDTANRLKVSAEGLQEWRFASEEAGLSADAFAQAVEGAYSALGKAQSGLKGSKGVVDAFGLLGISKDQLDGIRSVEELLPLIADGLQKVGSEAERAAIADKLGVRPLLPLLEEGSDKIADMREEAHKLGLVLDNETIAKMGDMQRQVEKASQVVDVQLKQAFLNLAPVLVWLSGHFAEFARNLNNFLEGFRKVGDRSQQALEAEQVSLARRIDQLKASGGADAPAGKSLLAALEARQIAGADALAAMHDISGAGVPGLASGDAPTLGGGSRGGSGRSKKDTRSTLGKLTDVPVATAFDIATGSRLTPEGVQEAADKENALGPSVLAKKVLLDVQLKPGLSEQLQPEFDRMHEGVKGAFSSGLYAAFDGHFFDYIKQRLFEAAIDGLAGLGANLLTKAVGGGGFWGTIASIFVRHGAGGPEEFGGLGSHAEYGPELGIYGRPGQVFDHDSTVRMLRDAAGAGGAGQAAAPVFQFTIDARGAGPREVDAISRRLDQFERAVPELIAAQAGPSAHTWLQNNHLLPRSF